jgi:hypothetical protein
VAEGKKQSRILASGLYLQWIFLNETYFCKYNWYFREKYFVNCTFWYYLEAEKQELINEAIGQAEAVVAAGKARAQSIELVSAALCNENGQNAAALAVAEKYVGAFGNLAKTNNTLILPANTGDVSSMVAQVSFKLSFVNILITVI